MNGCELSLAVSALACAIAKGKSSQQIALLAAFFTQLGDTLATIDLTNALNAQQCSDSEASIK